MDIVPFQIYFSTSGSNSAEVNTRVSNPSPPQPQSSSSLASMASAVSKRRRGATLASATSRSHKYHVTQIEERIHLRRKYKIKWAVDPCNGRKYSLGEIAERRLIDTATSMFYVPTSREVLGLDEAIRIGWIEADLIDEFFEASNESFEFDVEEQQGEKRTFLNIIHEKVVLNMRFEFSLWVN